jgi:hypothetical protein
MERQGNEKQKRKMFERESMLTDIQLLQVKNEVNRILHVPGNFSGGILEIAVVTDYCMDRDVLREECRQISNFLKKQKEEFRNVRCNLIKWISDECIIKEVIPMAYLQIGKAFEEEQTFFQPEKGKSLDELLRQLKLFYARSKVIMILTEGDFCIQDEEAVRSALQPFLEKKLFILKQGQIIRLTHIQKTGGAEWQH